MCMSETSPFHYIATYSWPTAECVQTTNSSHHNSLPWSLVSVPRGCAKVPSSLWTNSRTPTGLAKEHTIINAVPLSQHFFGSCQMGIMEQQGNTTPSKWYSKLPVTGTKGIKIQKFINKNFKMIFVNVFKKLQNNTQVLKPSVLKTTSGTLFFLYIHTYVKGYL